MSIEEQIQEIVDRETRAWDTQDLDLLLSIFHPDIIWPWPPGPHDHDPADWIFLMGRFDEQRWRGIWGEIFETHSLVHNNRRTVKITISEQGDAALATVDVDTLWRSHEGKDFLWKGRAGKGYTKMGQEWKLIMHTGLLEYPPR